MTDEEFLDWLNSQSAVRCVLIEAGVLVDGVETTRYMSNKGYVTSPDDTPANTIYQPIIAGGISITERLAIDGSASLSFGDIELYNQSGERDDWLNDVWVNRPIRAYIGDMRWPRADFRMIFDGVIADIDSRRRDRLNLKLRDKLQRLNTPVSETKLGGSTENADLLIPVCLGEVHNVTPLLTDPALLEFQVHDGAIEDIIEVRDNGVPVSITKNVANGKFTLDQSPDGQVTASVQGDKPSAYANTIAALVERLATGYGKESDRFTSADIDADNFAAFAAAHTQPVGLYLPDRANVLECCQRLADSVGAQAVMSREGLLRLLRIELPAPGTPTVITASDMIEHSIQIADRLEVIAAVKLGYVRNWTIQNNLLTGIPEEHKDLYAQEWLTVTKKDDTVADTYKLHVEPVQQDTLLLVKADAEAEAQRRLDLRKVPRTIYRFEGFPQMLMLELGQAVTLEHERFGLADGVDGQVVSLTPDWMTGRVTVEVLV